MGSSGIKAGVNGIRHVEEDKDDEEGHDKVVKYDAKRVEELCGTKLAKCGCSVRSKPPQLPERMSFEEREVDKLQQWMLDRYVASAFNVCTHQKLNKMSGPPLKLLASFL